ncbi:MAG: class I SAM-dependent methyltransferase [Deltaproteobacteria bacterium]|nr:class I SAM-dependent methyltransferase [Deltaproteobacteria bacterium]
MALWNPQDYDSWYESPLGRVSGAIEKSLIFSIAGVMPGETALDAGCGTGIYAIELARMGAHTAGFDNDPGMLMAARAKAARAGLAINLLAADAAAMPFGDGSFDVALSVGALCFFEDMDEALLETKRVLRPGGRCVIGALNRWSAWALLRRIKGLFKKTVYERARFLSPPRLKAALTKAGFESVEFSTCLYFLPINSSRYLRLAERLEAPSRLLCPNAGAFIAASARRPL